MSMITGVGDEVVEVTCVLVAAAVAALAWWSTAARPDRFRTVIVMERTTRTSPHNMSLMGRNISSFRRHLITPFTPSVTPSPAPASTPNSVLEPPLAVSEFMTEWHESGEGSASDSEVGSENAGSMAEGVGGAGDRDEDASRQVQEMDSIVDAMDADINVLRNRRLNFFSLPSDETTTAPTSEEDEVKSNEQQIVRNSETSSHINQAVDSSEHKCDTADSEHICEAERTRSSEPGGGDSAEKINIKLKYLNDTFREVDGSLDEQLKDFKWRHFATELSGQLRVLLIFNGHVLNEDANTLRGCGLYHNCVVHCLVHPPRQPRTAGVTSEVVPSLMEAAAGVVGAAGIEAEPSVTAQPPGAEPRAWDLENVLMTLVSIILTIIWFFRCEYSNIFTASASGALFALTVFYSVAIFGLYFSDTFHLTDRRTRENEQAQQRNQARVYT